MATIKMDIKIKKTIWFFLASILSYVNLQWLFDGFIITRVYYNGKYDYSMTLKHGKVIIIDKK